MTKALVLMKAMPPTTGHRDLIRFAEELADDVLVLIDSAPDEPMISERRWAVKKICTKAWTYVVMERNAPQDPDATGFWEWWINTLDSYGEFDYVVASEPYGARIARLINARFMPYDIARELNPVKATPVRDAPFARWNDIAQEFRPYLKTVVSTFGAESTGKSTLAKALKEKFLDVDYIFEYARPYLETISTDINVRAMEEIWHGQAALQRHAKANFGNPLLVQDTDLWLTVGYWEQPHWHDVLGDPPQALIDEARELQSDLYLFTPSNIAFEPDVIRYGGDRRESPDDFWLSIADKYNLPYVVLDSNELDGRLREASAAIWPVQSANLSKIFYDRQGR